MMGGASASSFLAAKWRVVKDTQVRDTNAVGFFLDAAPIILVREI